MRTRKRFEIGRIGKPTKRVKLDVAWPKAEAFRVPIPKDEPARLQNLHSYKILDTPVEESFDNLTTLAAQICGTPIALLSLVDSNRQWFKAKVGLSLPETSR